MIFSESQWQNIADKLNLSPRELQIVFGIFDDNKEFAIAAELDISIHTVHTHLVRLYQKLHVNSRVELVVRIMAQHLLQTVES